MPSFVAYSISPFGTGTIETGAGNITITSGVATLTVEQTGNIGVGVAIEYDTEDISYIAPNRIGFDSGGTAELLPDTKIEDATSGATGIVRFVELLSGTWAGGDAAGWIYFEKTTGTFGDDNQINRTKPTTSDNIATVNGTIEGNIGNGNTEFVVKSAIGADAADQTITAVTSIHHEYASLAAFEAGFTDATHVNNVALTTADVVAHACFYYDHDNYTVDSAQLLLNWGGTTDATRYLFIFSPNGDAESINRQSHLGIWDTEKAILEFEVTASNQSVIEITEDYVRIKSLQASMLDGGSIIKNYNRVIYTIASSVLNYRLVDSCILKNSGAPIDSKYLIETDDADTILDIINTVVYYGDGDHYGNAVFLDHCTTVNIFHCTVYGSLDMDGIERDEGTVTTTNTVSFHNLDDFDGTQTITFCASDDEDGSDSQLLDSSGTPAYDTEFTDAAGGDFSLPVGSICIDNGTSLAASQGIWRDIAGNERGATPDIGAFEYVAAGGTTYTVTTSIDSILKSAGIVKSVSLDSLLMKSFPINLSIDTLLTLLKTTSMSIDTLLRDTSLIKIIDIDTILKSENVNIATLLDMSLVDSYLKTLSVDTILKAVYTNTTSLDILLNKATTKTLFIDTILKALNITKTTTLDVLLSKIVTEDLSVDTILKALYTNTTLLDTILKALGITKTTDIDTILKKLGVTTTTDIDALLKELDITKTTTLDVLLSKIATEDLSIDTILKALYTNTTALDVILSGITTKTLFIDTILKILNVTKTIDIDVLLSKITTEDLSVDMILKELGVTTTTALDIVLASVGEISKTLFIDSILKKLNVTKTTDIDVLLSKIATEDLSVDTILQVLNIDTVTALDMILLNEEATKTLFIDTMLQIVNVTKTTTLDVLLSKIATEDLSVDTILKALGVTTTTALDMVLASAGEVFTTLSIDAILKIVNSKSVNIDLLLQELNKYATVSVDLLLKSLSIENNLSIDSILKNNNVYVNTDLDMILAGAAEVLKILSVDILLQNNDVSYTCNLDTLIRNSHLTTTSIDSILQKQILNSIVIDTLLQKENTQNTTIDILLSSLYSSFANLDTILAVGTTTNLVTLDLDTLLKSISSGFVYIDTILGVGTYYPRHTFNSGSRDLTFTSNNRTLTFTSDNRTLTFTSKE